MAAVGAAARGSAFSLCRHSRSFSFTLLHSFGRHPLHGKTLNRNVLVINLINHNEIQEPVRISFVHGE